MLKFKISLSLLIKYSIFWWSGLTTVATVFLSFFPWDDMKVANNITIKISIFIGMIVFSIAASVVTIYCKKEKKIFGDINRGVSISYGDLIQLGFPAKYEGKRIVVIPVNRCFDLSYEQNLVSNRSIHGQWISKYINSENRRRQLNQEIQENLIKTNIPYETLSKNEKYAGNTKRYPSGTIVELPGSNGVTFYLLAISLYDRNLRAQCSEIEFFNALQSLIDYYDSHGQGEKMYCPIMGDHFIRPTRETTDVIPFMLSVFRFNKNRIHGQIQLVVYEKLKHDIPILIY